jgi:hypothetical protein
MVFDPLTFNLNDESSYPQEANMSLVQAHGDPMYNPAGFARLAGRLADNKLGKNGTLAERDDLYMELLGGLLASANIPVSPEEVHQQAQRSIGYRGIVANSTCLIDITQQFTNTGIRDTQRCKNGFTYFDDQIKAPAIWSNNNLWFQNLEYYWSGIPWLLGSTSDLLRIGDTIQRWVSTSSHQHTCNGFTFAVYDDQNQRRK